MVMTMSNNPSVYISTVIVTNSFMPHTMYSEKQERCTHQPYTFLMVIALKSATAVHSVQHYMAIISTRTISLPKIELNHIKEIYCLSYSDLKSIHTYLFPACNVLVFRIHNIVINLWLIELASSAFVRTNAYLLGYPKPLINKIGGHMTKRNHRFELRLNDKEKDMLENKSRKAGINKSSVIKMCLNNSEIRSAPSLEYKELIKELNFIGHNINQIVKAINMGIALPEDINEIKVKLSEIYKIIKERL